QTGHPRVRGRRDRCPTIPWIQWSWSMVRLSRHLRPPGGSTCHNSDTMRRALIVLSVIVLAACRVDTTVDITMGQDGSGKITVTAVADAGVVSQAPGLADDLRFDDAEKAGWTVTAPTPTSDGGLKVELTHPFANPEEATALLQSINGSGGPL